MFLFNTLLLNRTYAQDWNIAVCSGGPPASTTSNLYGPMYSVATANATNRIAVIYPASQLSGLAGKSLSSVYFHRATASGSMAGTPSYKIYLKEVSNLDWGSTALDWATATTGATLMFDGNPAPIVGSSAGWKEFNFSSNFAYSGTQNLAVFLEYTNPTASAAIAWSYEYTAPCIVTTNNNTTKYTNNTTGTLPASLSTSNYRRPYIGFDFALVPCLGTPNAGLTISNKPINCTNDTVLLSLQNATEALNINYQWQESLDSNLWSNLITVNNDSVKVTSSTNKYYRCIVSCSGNADTSTPLFIRASSILNAGTYTLNSNLPTSGSNFNSFTDFTNALYCGTNGNVTLNVDSATYIGRVTFENILLDSTKKLTINGNGSKIIHTTDAQDLFGYVFGIVNSSYITVKNFTFELGATSTKGSPFFIQNSNNCIVENNIMLGDVNATATSYMGINISSNSNSTAGISTSAGNIIRNNDIVGGYYGVYLYGDLNNTGTAYGNIISNNTVRDFYIYGIYNYGADSTQIVSNDVHRLNRVAASTFYGIYLSGNSKSVNVTKNLVHDAFVNDPTVTSTTGGIYITSNDATLGREVYITNNSIYNIATSGTNYGIYNSGSDYINIYFNTIYFNNNLTTAGTTYGFYQSTLATGIDLKNNNISISKAGSAVKYCLYFNTATSTISSNYNNLFVDTSAAGAGAKVVAYRTSAFATLLDWQAANGAIYDQNSVSERSVFASSTVLVPNAPALNNIGLYIPSVLEDITGATRSVTPDIGAYEFTPVNDDAGLMAIVDPQGICPGPNVASARLRNYGAGVLSSVTVNWSVNGVVQTPIAFIGSLNPAADSLITLGSFNVVKGNLYTIRAWTSNPNGSIDANASNDTVEVAGLTSGLLDTVTVGGAGSDFATLSDLMNVLNANGICGPLTVDVNPAAGPYNEQLVIGNISGTSPTDTILFKGNGSVITWNSSISASRYTILLDGANYVTLDSFQVYGSMGSTTSNYGWGIKVNSNSHYNTIKNNKIYVSDSTSSTNYAGIVFSGSLTSATTAGVFTYNKVINNEINGGYYGVIIYGTSGNITGTRANIVANNTIKRPYYYGIYIGYQDSVLVNNNKISNPSRPIISTTNYGIYNVGALRSTITNNTISDYFRGNLSTSNSFYGIAFSAADNTAGNMSLVANNEIYGIGANGTLYGLYNSSSNGIQNYHNSINFDHPTATSGVSYGVYQTTLSTDLEYKNNSISITRAGVGLRYGYYFVTNTTVAQLNYNNIYVPGGNVGYWSATAYSSLASWQTANGGVFDLNSISQNPLYNGSRNLIPQNGTPLASVGTPLTNVVFDRLGNVRSGVGPFIGAYEITGDFAGPQMQAGPISNTTSVSNYTVSNILNATDVAGVDTTIGNRPRLYYKRSKNANTYVDNTSASNGWKWVEATNTTAPFSFVIDYSKLDSAVLVGDVIDYFYASKDLLGNTSIYPALGNEDPTSLDLSGVVFPVFGFNNYNIGTGISGTILVGTGNTYTSLTGTSGVFNYINGNIVNGNVDIVVTSDLTETGAVALDQITETGIGGYTVTIKPNGDTLRNITGSFVGGLIRLNGADRITIDGSGSDTGQYFRIQNNTATSNNAAIQLISLGNNLGSSNITIKNSIIVAGTGGNAIGIHIGGPTIPYSAGSSNKNITITGNTIFRGSVGIYVGGVDSAKSDSLIITNNILGTDVTAENLRLYGMALEETSNSRIEGNTIKNIINTAAQQGWGIALYDGFANGIIRKNNIYNVSSGSGAFAGRGIEIISNAPNENILIENNFIADMKGAGSNNLNSTGAVGISVRATGGVKMYYNSIHMPSVFSATTSSTATNFSAGIHIGPSTGGIEMINNSISNTRFNSADTSTAYALYSEVGDTSYLTVDYNNYYVHNSQGAVAYFPNTGNIADLAALKLATSKNTNSISVFPNYISDIDLHAQGVGMYQKGTNIATVNTDIDGDIRNASTPCIGADEYIVPPTDLKIVDVIYPNNYHCGPASDSIMVVVENFGTAVQTGFTVKANLSQAVTANLSKVYSGNLAVGSKDTISVGYYNANVNDTLTIEAIVDASGDADRLNDTIVVDRILLPTPVAPTLVSNDPACIGGPATLVVSSAALNIEWYDQATGGNLLATNDTLITPTITRTDTFYAQANNSTIQSGTVGPLSPSVVGANSGTAAAITTYYMEFQVFQTTKIVSVDVFPTAAIGSNGGIDIRTPAGVSMGVTNYVTTVTGGNKQTVNLNITLEPGIYRMGQIPAITLLRNTSGASYPYTSDAIHILSNNFGAGYYYYFFNWQLERGVQGCPSERLPVIVTTTPRPSGATVAQASPFDGVFNAGTLANPDEACLADTLTYLLTPPTGFNAGDLGTTWLVSNPQVKTINGANPAGTVSITGLNLQYVAAAGDLDSTLVFTAKVVNIATGCDSDITRYLKVNTVPNVNLGTDQTVCAGTPVILDAGNVGSTYLWNTGETTQTISVDTAGTYTVMVTNSAGCFSMDTVVINTITLPVKNLGPDVVVCAGTPVTLDAGNPGATYLWNTGATTQTINALSNGIYIVEVTAAGGCSVIDTVVVTFNANPVVNLGNDQLICTSDILTLDAGNVGSTYLWSTGATTQTIQVSLAGTYSVTVTNANGCVSTDEVVITNRAEPNATFTDTALNGLNVKFTAVVVAGHSYSWNFGDPTSPSNTSLQPTPIHEFTAPGTYTVTLTVTNVSTGCVKVETRTITVVFVGISSANKETFNFYAAPNPYVGSTKLNFNLNKTSMVSIEMYDLLGRKVKDVQSLTEMSAGSHIVELSNENVELANGVYLVKLKVDGIESVIRIQDNSVR